MCLLPTGFDTGSFQTLIPGCGVNTNVFLAYWLLKLDSD